MPRRSNFQSPIRYVREAAGLTPAEFSHLIGVSRFHLQDLELGTRAVTDRVAAAIALRWGLAAKSLMGQRSRPAFDDGSEIVKPPSDSDVRAYFRTIPNTRFAQMNAKVPKAVEGLIARLESVFEMAVVQQSAPLLYAELRNWLRNAEKRLGMSGQLRESDSGATKKGEEGERPDDVDAIRDELEAPMHELEAAVISQMKENISTP